jgi:molybdopterin synthase catalytic subunit|tara:strand:+ start:1115 stop:1582 length:468 start_codon:yes stop_codon:yes gene_type:complete
MHYIAVQEKDFNVGYEYQQLIKDNSSDGAVVFFVGRMREFNQGQNVSALTLEHYPGMTEKALNDIIIEARQRFNISRSRVIHRVGDLSLQDQIVFVGISSPHRDEAFAAAQFIMDYLKTRAPFWKKETTSAGNSIWLDATESDATAAQKWAQSND